MPNAIQIANGQHHKILEGGRPFLDTLDMRLFVANVVPSGIVQPDLADECTDTGYVGTPAPITLTFPTPATTDGAAGVAAVSAPTIVLSHAGGDFTIFGVFWTDPADADVTVMSQRMDTPFTVTVAGQVFLVSGAFALDTEEA